MKTFAMVATLCGLLLLSPYLHATGVSVDQDNDRVHIGKSIDVGPSENVGDVVCIGCPIRVAGKVTGDLVAVGGRVQVDGTVQGDTTVVGGNLQLGPGAVIHGDVALVGGKLERDPTARVDGEISNPALIGHGGGLALLLLAPFLFMLVVGVVLCVLCVAILGERRIEIIVDSLRRHTGLGLLAGLGVLVGFVILLVVFHWTGPLAPLVFVGSSLALLALAIVGYAGVSAWIGHGLAPAAGLMGAVIAGAVLVGVLQAVPLLGAFAFVIFGLLALGGAALSGLGTNPEWLSQRLSNRGATPPSSAAGGR
ncbi:MAG TPA: polymer-forming cytoskeletal protein [Terriglobales bacterium]|nr:polymer-forming cytoskeletal protein [Terriglobales bacterium]